MNFYISDTHFGHANILHFDNRPFGSVADMEDEMVKRWNAVVKPGDTVYILGDFCWQKEPEWIRILNRLNGGKVLIRGNHDLKNPSVRLRGMFQDIKEYKEITDNGRHIIMCHYPILFYKAAYNPDCYMLCGHVHTTRENDFLDKWKDELRKTRTRIGDSYGQIINVGCMLPYMDYTPRTLDEILEGVSE
jgi:calcineurin-like phosphoesterase family protein